MKILLAFIILPSLLFSQQQNQANSIEKFLAEKQAYSIFNAKLKKFNIAETLKSRNLPTVVDNSQFMFFPPITSQEFIPSCQQHSSIYYAFTYELNRVRNQSAETFQNIIAPLFSYNYYGPPYYGFNYLQSYNILQQFGSPSVATFGIFNDDNRYWMSGYEKYYEAMQNRLENMQSLYVGDEEGLDILKQYLYDHAETGSGSGGVVNFQTPIGLDIRTLPHDSPETGKSIIFKLPHYYFPAHGMTIVGFHDSIRYDVNGDGQYTNYLDITGDGKIDMQDMEIGGLKFANSYGTDFADEGFCYMLYRTLAMEDLNGGIYLNTVHISVPKDDYKPRLTLKVTIKHNQRNQIKISAGINSDYEYPEHIIDFPIFNYNGYDGPMQGNDTEAGKTLELGLDISPLLQFAENGEEANFFLIVNEQDPSEIGKGKIIDFSIINYDEETILQEFESDDKNVVLNNNSATIVSLQGNVQFDTPKITTNELIPFNENNSQQLVAEGGKLPYSWSLLKEYSINNNTGDYSEIGTIIYDYIYTYPADFDDYGVELVLPFSFPFYDKTYDTVFISKHGFIDFEPLGADFHYNLYPFGYLKSLKCIAPFIMTGEKYSTGGYIKFYETNDFIQFFWNIQMEFYDADLQFSVKLFPDGSFEILYGNMKFYEYPKTISGISNGDDINYQIINEIHTNFQKHDKYTFQNISIPNSIKISEDGLLISEIIDDENNYDITVRLTDFQNISDRKTLTLSNGLEILHKQKLKDGYTVLDIILKNKTNQNLNNVRLSYDDYSGNVTIINNNIVIEQIQAMDSFRFEEAFKISALDTKKPIKGRITATSTAKTAQKEIFIYPYFSDFIFSNLQISDNHDNKLQVGEEFTLSVDLKNTLKDSPHVYLELKASQYIDILIGEIERKNIKQNEVFSVQFRGKVKDTVPHGALVTFKILVNDEGFGDKHTFVEQIGLPSVLVIDKGEDKSYSIDIKQKVEFNGLFVNHSKNIPEDCQKYQCLFITFGGNYTSNYVFSNYFSKEEEQHLISYLQNGGNIYLEGRNKWLYIKDSTNLFDYFNIQLLSTTLPFNIFLVGEKDGFIQDSTFYHFGAGKFLYYIEPLTSDAFEVLKTYYYPFPDSLSNIVANESGNYKTIASLVILAKLADDPDYCNPQILVDSIIAFFEIERFAIAEPKELPQPHEGSKQILVFPNPSELYVHFDFSESAEDEVFIEIYDLTGRKMNEIKANNIFYNPYFRWNLQDYNGRKLPQGTYICSLKNSQQTWVAKILIF